MRTTVLAIAITAACAIVSTGAQAPSAAKSELDTILYKAADALGMLRGVQEADRIVTFEYWATGTMSVGGKPCKLSEYRGSVRYPISGATSRLPVPAMRVDFTCAGQARQIHSVAGRFAWNETEPGAGKATPMPGAVNERLLQTWTLPQGLIKAARMAGANTKVTAEGGSPVLTFPLPAPLEGGTVRATLNTEVFLFHTMPSGVKREFSHRIMQVETRLGNVVTETTFSEYGDWNDKDYKSDALLPRRIVQRRGGATILDLTISRSNTYNPYVLVPVPRNVEQAAGQ
jgi:hypothetical protein